MLLLGGFVLEVWFEIVPWFRKANQNDDSEGLVSHEDTSVEGKMEISPVRSDEGKPKTSMLVKCLLCFAPYNNLRKIMSVSQTGDSNLASVNGIRALSMFWVILGHVYFFLITEYDNPVEAISWLKRFNFMMVPAGFYAVDSFFLLSGFLAYWSLAKMLKPESIKSAKNFFVKILPMIYINRYIRLTAPYAPIILISLGLWPHLSNGPLYQQTDDLNCQKNWWRNLLYINNFGHETEMCVGWSWYLAVDMQVFLLMPFVVALFQIDFKKIHWGWIASFTLIIIQCCTAFGLTISDNLPSQPLPPYGSPEAIAAKDYNDYFRIVYVTPWCRLGPYVVGVMFAHLGKTQSTFIKRRILNNRILTTIIWILDLGVFFALIFGQQGFLAGNYVNPSWADGIYNAIGRTGWGIALGWILIACMFEKAGFIAHFLRWPVWGVFARLSYVAYLLHPFILIFYETTLRRPFHATDLNNIFLFLSVTLSAYMCAVLHSLAFESPVIGLQRMFLK